MNFSYGVMNKKPKKYKPKICIYGIYCYPLFNPQYTGHFGGWEVRGSIIAKEIAKRGQFDVTMIVADHGQPHIEYREDVRLMTWVGREFWRPPSDQNYRHDEIITAENPKNENMTRESQLQKDNKSFTRSILSWVFNQKLSGKNKAIVIFFIINFSGILRNLKNYFIKGFKTLIRLLIICKFQLKRVFSVFGVFDPNGANFVWYEDIEIMDKIDADIYIVPGNHIISALTAYYCKERSKNYVFLAGSDMDYDTEIKKQPQKSDIYGEPHYLKLYAIEQANVHFVQTQRQADILKENFGRSGYIIKNPIDLTCIFPKNINANKILWIGTSDERVKRPSLIFELAKRLPDYPFVVIMRYADGEIFDECLKMAQLLRNVTIITDVPYLEIESYFSDAKLFINTSVFEGFPNTFLQAAKYGVPVVATDVDPDGMLSQYGCGITCGGDFERFVQGVQRLMTDETLYNQTSAASLNYVRTYHDKDIIIPQYEKELQDVLLS